MTDVKKVATPQETKGMETGSGKVPPAPPPKKVTPTGSEGDR